jgi:hypothetical protein
MRLLSVLLLALFSGELVAQQLVGAEPEEQVHWAVAAFFGTGWYKVDENRSAFIFRIPPRQTVQEAGWHENGKRKLGIEIQYPVALGLHTLDDIPDFIEFDNYGTIAFTPGVQVEIPVNEKWSLRPYGHLGFGYEKESNEWAAIWYGGVKSRYKLGESERLRWSLLNAVYYAGYKPEYKNRGRYASAMAGLEFNQPLRRFKLGGNPVWLNWHVTYNYLFDRLNFHVDEERVESIEDQWEVGVALGRGQRRVKIWFLSFEHVGLSYKWSSNGRYKAISLNLRSPFTY